MFNENNIYIDFKSSKLKTVREETQTQTRGKNIYRRTGSGGGRSVQTVSSAQLQGVHTLSSAQLDGSPSTDWAKPVLLESTPVQLRKT